MGKKKGGAKNKLARMSEEERARYLQHRADIEEEARRRKQQLIALYMKNKLKREEAFSRLNLAKINQEWRFILRQIKCQELRSELLNVERHFRDALDQKNRIIRRLLADLDEAEDLYSTLQQSHMENIARLIGIQSQRMLFWKDKYLREKLNVLAECSEDFERYKQARNKSQVRLECVFYALQDVAKTEQEELDEKHFQKLHGLRSTMTIKLEAITRSREDQLEQLWKEYQQVLDEYVHYTDTFHADYSNLRERDEQNTNLIRKHCNEVARVTELIAELKIEADNVTDEHDFQLNYLNKYRKKLNDNYGLLKKGLEQVLKFDNVQFKHMIVTSESSLRVLRNLSKKGENLLQLASICRRLESEREKVLPFGNNQVKPDERTDEEAKTTRNDLKNTSLGLWLNLENFWSRIYNTRLDCACLIEEKTILERENAELKLQIKGYLTLVTLEAGTGGRVEERLQDRPSSMKVEKVVHINLQEGPRFQRQALKRRPVTCIEGNLSNAIRSAQLIAGKSNVVTIKRIVNNW